MLLLAIAAVILLWLDGARARELASAVAAEMCRRRGYQLLDDTVALARFGFARSAQGLRIRRMFGFDYSKEGVGRRSGVVIMRGGEVELVDLNDDDDEPSEPRPGDATPQGGKHGDDKVIPFRRRH